MSTQPTSALEFRDLILAIAKKKGVAYYGENGTEVAQIPEDEHDLAECKEHANNAVRMFQSDAPPAGWKWTRPLASVTLWADIAVAASATVTGGPYDAIVLTERTPSNASNTVAWIVRSGLFAHASSSERETRTRPQGM